MRTTRHVRVRARRGVALLATCLVLMLIAGLAVMHGHRAQQLDAERTRMRAAGLTAFEVAESGLAWSLARLNDTTPMDAASASRCAATAAAHPWPGGRSYRAWTLPWRHDISAVVAHPSPASGARATCDVAPNGSNARLQCQCATGPSLAPPSTTASAGFSLRYEPVVGDEQAIKVTSVGCSVGAACVHGDRLDATVDLAAAARVVASMVVRTVPLLATVPSAALTVGGNVIRCPGTSIDAPNAGSSVLASDPAGTVPWAVHAGQAVAAIDARCTAPPVQAPAPPAIAPATDVAQNDASLAVQAATFDRTAKTLLGRSVEQILAQARATHCTLSGSRGGSGGVLGGTAGILDVSAAVHALRARTVRPCDTLVVDGDALLHNASLAPSPSNTADAVANLTPLLLVVTGHLTLSGDTGLQGVVLANEITLSTSNVTPAVRGAMVASRQAAWLSGRLAYDAAVLAVLASNGPYVPVSASWKDHP
jgi:hypothetical protein